MIDIKFLRENPETVKENIKKKFQDEKIVLVNEVIELDKELRAAQLKADNLRGDRNKLSKQIGGLMAQGKKDEAEQIKAQVKQFSDELEELEKKEEELKKRAAEAEERLAEIDALRAKEMERLETLAGLSQEDAREVLLHKVDEELTHEKAVRVAAYETDLKENCDNIARNLIGQAISRCAADHCSCRWYALHWIPANERPSSSLRRGSRGLMGRPS